MKKLVFLAIVAAMMFSGCSKSETPAASGEAPAAQDQAQDKAQAPAADTNDAAKLLEGVEMTEEGLMGIFKDEKEMTEAELEALLLSFGKCDAKPSDTSLNTSKCASSKVMSNVLYTSKTKRNLAADKKFDVFMKHIADENPIIRDACYKYIDISSKDGVIGDAIAGKGLNAGDTEAINAVIAKAKDEKDPRVLKTLVERVTLIDSMKDNPELIQFILDCSKHEKAFIREALPTHIAANRLAGHPEGAQMIKDMCLNDSDMKVRSTACGRISDFEVEDYKKLAVDVLKNAELADGHGKLASTLFTRAIGYPKYETTDDEAMKIVMDYIKTTPRGKNIPHWSAIVELTKHNKDKMFNEAVAKLPSFKPAELVKACQDIITDPNAVYLSRTNCCNVILTYGKLDDLKAVVDPLTKSVESGNDKDGKSTLKSVNEQIEKAAK